MQTRISCIDSIFITDQHGKDVCVLLTRFSDHVYDLNWHHCLLMKHPFYWKLKNKFVFTCNWIQVTVAIHIPGGFYRSLFWFLDARARVFDNRKHGLSKIRKIEDIWGLRGLTPLEKDGWTLLAMPEGPGAVFCLKICGFTSKSRASNLWPSHLSRSQHQSFSHLQLHSSESSSSAAIKSKIKRRLEGLDWYNLSLGREPRPAQREQVFWETALAVAKACNAAR